MDLPIEIAGGSATGLAHLTAGRNNQDAFCWSRTAGRVVAVVCDGCGSAPHSEVGAKIGARLLVQALSRGIAVPRGPDTGGSGALEDCLAQGLEEVLAHLRLLASAMSSADFMTYRETVLQYFLFTAVGVVIDGESASVFSMGDGLIVVNGERHIVGPFPDNEPPYLGYALIDPNRSREFDIRPSIPLRELDSLVLATDGVTELGEPLEPFWEEDGFFRNSDRIRRRLVMIRRERAFVDDATLVVLRRQPDRQADGGAS